MPWIESHTDLDKHPKLISLQKAMRWNTNETVGFLHRFWWRVMDFAPSGDVTLLSSPKLLPEMLAMKADIALHAIRIMEEVGFLTRKGDKLLVHDWLDYTRIYLRDTKYKRDREEFIKIERLHGEGDLALKAGPPNSPQTVCGTLPNHYTPCARARGYEFCSDRGLGFGVS